MHIVTGGAGFIGSEIVAELNRRGEEEILVVDDMSDGEKCVNLADCRIADYMDREEFIGRVAADGLPEGTRAVLHQGACTDTMEADGRYMMANNFSWSKRLMEACLAREVPFVYASSAATYGASEQFTEDEANERPLNVYGYSKLAFDQHVRRRVRQPRSTVAGLRYFNVYGPRETKKGRMASMVYQLYRQLRETGRARLFRGSDGYGDGEQRRDFVFVGDVVAVNLALTAGPARLGIYNVGSGQSRPFNAVANILIQTLGRGDIEYFDFPEALRGKYQNYTEADLTRLRSEGGYEAPTTPLEEGIPRCVAAWDRTEG